MFDSEEENGVVGLTPRNNDQQQENESLQRRSSRSAAKRKADETPRTEPGNDSRNGELRHKSKSRAPESDVSATGSVDKSNGDISMTVPRNRRSRSATNGYSSEKTT